MMLSLDGSQITFEAVLKSQENASGIAYDPAAFNSTTVVAPQATAVLGAKQGSQAHPVAVLPSAPGDMCQMPAVPVPSVAYSVLGPVPVPVSGSVTGSHNDSSQGPAGLTATKVNGSIGSRLDGYQPVSALQEHASGFIPSCTRPYGMTTDELITAWPVREWSPAPTPAQVDRLVSQCQAMNKFHNTSVPPRASEFDLPVEQLAYALAMLANWDCARMYQILTSVDVDFRAVALRVPQAGLWFRCQPPMLESRSASAAPHESDRSSHPDVNHPCDENGLNTVFTDRSHDDRHSTGKARCSESDLASSGLVCQKHVVQDAVMRRKADCNTVKV